MLTYADIQRLEKKFATKEELKDEIKKTNEHIDMTMKVLIEFIGEVRDDLLARFSKIGKQLEDIKAIEENHQYKLDNHETRIQHLESITKAN